MLTGTELKGSPSNPIDNVTEFNEQETKSFHLTRCLRTLRARLQSEGPWSGQQNHVGEDQVNLMSIHDVTLTDPLANYCTQSPNLSYGTTCKKTNTDEHKREVWHTIWPTSGCHGHGQKSQLTMNLG